MGFINTDKKRTDPRVFLDREDILDLIEKNGMYAMSKQLFLSCLLFMGWGVLEKAN
ncbi:MAG: hypothetical protein ACLU6P_18775 [Roseburia intestinalis]